MDSVIFMVCLNHSAITKRCIESVLATTSHFNDVELVVFNNGSTDNTSTMLGEFETRGLITVMEFPTNIGVPKAMNIGHDYAGNRMFIKMANDHILTSGWLECLLDIQSKKPGLWSPVTIDTPVIPFIKLGPLRKKLNRKLLNRKVITDSVVDQYLKQMYPMGLEAFSRDANNHIAIAKPRMNDVWTGLQSVHPDVKDKIGYMDERFGMHFGADFDYIYRARSARFIAAARGHFIHHWGSLTLRKRCSGWDDLKEQDYADNIMKEPNSMKQAFLDKKHRLAKQGISEYEFQNQLYRVKVR